MGWVRQEAYRKAAQAILLTLFVDNPLSEDLGPMAASTPEVHRITVKTDEPREDLPTVSPPVPAVRLPARVAQKIPRNNWNSAAGSSTEKSVAGPQASSDSEWDKLSNFPWPVKEGKGIWDAEFVREASVVRDETQRKCEKPTRLPSSAVLDDLVQNTNPDYPSRVLTVRTLHGRLDDGIRVDNPGSPGQAFGC